MEAYDQDPYLHILTPHLYDQSSILWKHMAGTLFHPPPPPGLMARESPTGGPNEAKEKY